MVEILVDESIKRLAIEHSAERMRYEYDRFGFNNEKRRNMILIGTIGQLVFKKFLDDNEVKYNYELQAGNYDNFDFVIGNDIFEIKTSGYYVNFNRLNLLYSQDQYMSGLAKGFKYCVQIFIDGLDAETRLVDISQTTRAVIAGCIEFKSISRYRNFRQYYGDDYKVPLTQLKNILDILKNYNK